MTFAEMMFYAESGGLLPKSRKAKIDAVIADIKKMRDPVIETPVFEFIAKSHGLDPKSISLKERQYIDSCLAH